MILTKLSHNQMQMKNVTWHLNWLLFRSNVHSLKSNQPKLNDLCRNVFGKYAIEYGDIQCDSKQIMFWAHISKTVYHFAVELCESVDLFQNTHGMPHCKARIDLSRWDDCVFRVLYFSLNIRWNLFSSSAVAASEIQIFVVQGSTSGGTRR